MIALAGGEPHATTGTGILPVSFAPPLVLVSFAAASRMAGWLERSDRFSVNLLAAGDAGRPLLPRECG